MHSRVLSLLLVLLLTWVGFSTPVRAHAPVQALSAEVAAVASPAGDTAADPAAPLDNPAPAQTPSVNELVADLPVVIHHGADAPLPTGTMARPGPHAPAAWRSACLDSLQRPPCLAASAA